MLGLKMKHGLPPLRVAGHRYGWQASPRQRANRLLKSYYLHHLKPWDTAALESALEFAETDICEDRPHGRLHGPIAIGLTPNMAYQGLKPDIEKLTTYKQNARIDRIQSNQNAPCCGMTILRN